MDKAKEILYKHAKSNGCRSDLLRNPFLEQAVLNAINEALRIHNIVEQGEQLTRESIYDEPCDGCNTSCKHWMHFFCDKK